MLQLKDHCNILANSSGALIPTAWLGRCTPPVSVGRSVGCCLQSEGGLKQKLSASLKAQNIHNYKNPHDEHVALSSLKPQLAQQQCKLVKKMSAATQRKSWTPGMQQHARQRVEILESWGPGRLLCLLVSLSARLCAMIPPFSLLLIPLLSFFLCSALFKNLLPPSVDL